MGIAADNAAFGRGGLEVARERVAGPTVEHQRRDDMVAPIAALLYARHLECSAFAHAEIT